MKATTSRVLLVAVAAGGLGLLASLWFNGNPFWRTQVGERALVARALEEEARVRAQLEGPAAELVKGVVHGEGPCVGRPGSMLAHSGPGSGPAAGVRRRR